MVAEGNDVAQQAGVVDWAAPVADDDHRPIRLPGDQAVGFEQVGIERFFGFFTVDRSKQRRGGLVGVAANIEFVQQDARRVAD